MDSPADYRIMHIHFSLSLFLLYYLDPILFLPTHPLPGCHSPPPYVQVTEAVEEEKAFSFFFYDAGQVGRPVIQMEGVTFGYGVRLQERGCIIDVCHKLIYWSVCTKYIAHITVPAIELNGQDSPPLFRDVHLGIEQTSRIALVGPNGAGKSTLLALIQDKLKPTVRSCTLLCSCKYHTISIEYFNIDMRLRDLPSHATVDWLHQSESTAKARCIHPAPS